MTEHYRCRHGLTLSENCDACEIDAARELVDHWGSAIDAARRLIAAAPKDRYVEHFMQEGRAQGVGND